MDHLIEIQDALQNPQTCFIDLRAPVEYLDAHIPGAINLPLLENDERAHVGILYKEHSPQLAIEQGLACIAPKLPDIYMQLKKLAENSSIVLYCWRGGMRSQSVSQIISLLNVPHYRLVGGYRAFRHLVNAFFDQPFTQDIKTLHGLTGVGKTEILERLKSLGHPVINLEALANHRGSVFGHIGLGDRPSQKQFEGRLFLECLKYKDSPCLMVEGESKRIGSVVIPNPFFQAMQNSPRILIYDTLQNRVKRLVNTYSGSRSLSEQEHLSKAIESLKIRLGQKQVREIQALLEVGNREEVAERLLVQYYDPLYAYPDGPSLDYPMRLDGADQKAVLQSLIKLFKA